MKKTQKLMKVKLALNIEIKIEKPAKEMFDKYGL